MAELKESLSSFTQQMDKVETAVTSQGLVIQQLQTVVEMQQDHIRDLWHQQDDLEDCHRRNNIRLRGLPEATATEDLRPQVLGIFNMLLGKKPTQSRLNWIECTEHPPSTTAPCKDPETSYAGSTFPSNRRKSWRELETKVTWTLMVQ